jgi:hypothetical protein
MIHEQSPEHSLKNFESAWTTPFDIIKHYLGDLFKIILHPVLFFRQMPTKGGMSWPLAFALVTHWLGSAVQFLWRTLIGASFGRYIDNIFKMAGDVAEIDSPGRGVTLLEMRERITNWVWGAGPVIADPFLTLASILFTSFLVYVGARILVTPGKNGAPNEIRFESALRIVCFGMSPAILGVFPFVGGFLAWVISLIVTIIGAREVYRISTGRSLVVALFPKLLFLGIMLMGLFFIAFLFIKTLITFF